LFEQTVHLLGQPP